MSDVAAPPLARGWTLDVSGYGRSGVAPPLARGWTLGAQRDQQLPRRAEILKDQERAGKPSL